MWSGRRDSASKLSQITLCSRLSQMCLITQFFLIPSASKLRWEPWCEFESLAIHYLFFKKIDLNLIKPIICGAEDEIRTRDICLGKATLYH